MTTPPSSVVKTTLFETTALMAFVTLGLLGPRLDNWFALPKLGAGQFNYLGGFLVASGVVLRVWSSFLLFDQGKGSPLYARPTVALVTTGPYRHMRNPLYVGGFLIYLGILIIAPSVFMVVLGLAGLPITYVAAGFEGGD